MIKKGPTGKVLAFISKVLAFISKVLAFSSKSTSVRFWDKVLVFVLSQSFPGKFLVPSSFSCPGEAKHDESCSADLLSSPAQQSCSVVLLSSPTQQFYSADLPSSSATLDCHIWGV